MIARGASAGEIPEFLRPLAEGLGHGPMDSNAHMFLRVPDRDAVPTAEGVRRKESAVLILIGGRSLDEAVVVIEERAHTMRSQPAQFALPGGRRDPEDSDLVVTALREAHEEIGLSSGPTLHVLGAFTPIRMPVRPMDVTPVVAWQASAPTELLESLTPNPTEVERILAAALVGPGSLTDPDVPSFAKVGEKRVGIGFDLPLDPHTDADDAFVWGFTASVLGGLLTHVVPGFAGPTTPLAKQVPVSRLTGERKGPAAR